jgi:site-specific recombinase XerD
MSTIKLVLRQKPRKDGTLPVCLRITKDRKTSFIHLGYHIKESDWDEKTSRVKKSHPNAARMNNLLLKKLAEANDEALDLEAKQKQTSAKSVKQQVKPQTGATFFPQAESFLAHLKSQGKYNQYTSDKPRIEHFRNFLNKNDIAFSDITVGLLERFKSYLRQLKPYKNRPPLSERTIMNHLVVLRSVYAHARKNGVVTKEQSPFGENGIKIKFPDSLKIGLTPQEVKQVEDAQLSDPAAIHARNLWLFSFYFAGMRVSDVLRIRWSDIQNERLHYLMGKNTKGGSIKIPEKAMNIIKQYEHLKENKDDLIFPELRDCDFDNKFLTQRTIAFKTSAIDKCLRNHVAPAAELDKKLTMHIARHTFGNISGDKIPIQMLQKLYRHSSITTTIGYQGNFIHKDADDALDAVLSLTPNE